MRTFKELFTEAKVLRKKGDNVKYQGENGKTAAPGIVSTSDAITEDRMSVSKATIVNTKRYEVIYALNGDDSDIEIYDKEKEETVVEEMEATEDEVKKILKKYKIKG